MKCAIALAFLAVLLVGVPAGASASSSAPRSNAWAAGPIPSEDVEKVELLYFHPRFRCASCNAVEKYAREVVEADFSREVDDGRLGFRILDISDAKNNALVRELGVTGSSLYVVVSGGGRREHGEIKSVWLDWNKPEKCRKDIADEVESALAGEIASDALPLAGMPVVLAALLLGLLTAISPCPLATNIAALSYVSRKLDDRRYTVLASGLYTCGRIVAYTLIGILLVLIGLSASRVSLFIQDYVELVLGPLLVFFGLVMLDVIKFSLFKGRVTSAVQKKIGDWGLLSSFLLGFLFALAFCPYSAILFFGVLIPIALESGGGIALPAIYGLGTGLPVMIFAIALTLGISELGKHVSRIQKFEKYFRWFAGVVFIGVGIYYVVVLVRSFF